MGSVCLVKYYDSTDQVFWSPDTGWSQPYATFIEATVTGMPSLNVTWSTNQAPGTQTGHCSTWFVQCTDGGHWGSDQESFCP